MLVVCPQNGVVYYNGIPLCTNRIKHCSKTNRKTLISATKHLVLERLKNTLVTASRIFKFFVWGGSIDHENLDSIVNNYGI